MVSRLKQTLLWSRNAHSAPAKQDPCMRLGIRTAIIADRASLVTDCSSSPTAETIWSLMVLASVWLT